MIKPHARNRLTHQDFEFISSTLGGDRSSARKAIQSLLVSAEERDEILDAPQLFERIMAEPSLSQISPYLYFYVLVRHVLQEYDIEERDVADYLASMLTEFSRGQRAHLISEHHEKQYHYLVDLLKDLMDANQEEVFYIQSHVGNYSMFLSGLFPDYIYHRAKYSRMAPDFSYYEQMGSTGYQQAARHRVAEQWQLSHILELLGNQFRKIRLALNYMVDHYMKMDDKPQTLEKVMRRVQTFIDEQRNVF